MPEVSVVIPYNVVGPFFRDAVRSVLASDFQDFEVILVADRVPPSQVELVRQGFSDQRISTVNSEGEGLVAALNTGIRRSRGKYVARMDSDDISAPMRLTEQFRVLHANPKLSVVGSQVEFICEHGSVLGLSRYPTRIWRGHIIKPFWSKLAHPATMIRKSSLELIGGYRELFEAAEDLDLWNRLLRIGGAVNIPRPLLKYRQHPNQFSNTRASQMRVFTHIAASLDIAEVFESKRMADRIRAARSSEMVLQAISSDRVQELPLSGRLRTAILRLLIGSELLANSLKACLHTDTKLSTRQPPVLKAFLLLVRSPVTTVALTAIQVRFLWGRLFSKSDTCLQCQAAL